MNEFYDKQQKLIDMHGFDGTRMFNMDESGITTVQKHCKVFGKKGKKNRFPYKWGNGSQYNSGVLHKRRGKLRPPNGDFQT